MRIKYTLSLAVLALAFTLNLYGADGADGADAGTGISAGGAATAATNSVPNFINQVAVWGTSFNTNYSWSTVKVQIEDGYKQATGSGASDYLRVQYDRNAFNVGLEGEFLGIGSQFTAVEGEIGYALVSKYDFKLEANLLAGYDRSFKSFEIEPEIKATKMLTVNTYATAGLSVPWFAKGTFDATPQIRVGAGFTF
jgi:hypothetical protein